MKKNMNEVMRTLVTSSECRRQIILQYFGYSIEDPVNPVLMCCDIHKSQCKCSSCTTDDGSDEALRNMNISACISDTEVHEDLPTPPLALYNDLLEYRQNLSSGRTCVGSVSLSSGFSIELIDAVFKSFNEIDSVDHIMEHLPVFSRANAEVIYKILCKYKVCHT